MARKPVPLFLNPVAGRGRAGRHAQSIVEILEAGGVPTELIESQAAGDLERRISDVARSNSGPLIVAGGDGSVHEAVNGLMAAARKPLLGVIPTGSGNDFAKACNIDLAVDRAASELADRIVNGAAPRAIDVGRCNNRYFANGIGIGFDATVNYHAKRVRVQIGNLVYVVGLVRAMIEGIVSPELRVIAGDYRFWGRATIANIANGPWLGGRFRIAPDADNGDGSLELVLAEPVTRMRMLALLPSLMRGEHLAAPEVHYQRIKRVVVITRGPTPVHLDGEPIPATNRFEIEVVPAAISIL